MARYRGPVCRLCRREGQKLMLKGQRCLTPRCPVSKRDYPPGDHGQRRMRKVSDYAVQLREKQKAKRIYGVLERQFRRYFKIADKWRGITGTNLLILLESRLDNVVYRLGFAHSRSHARQLVRHNHVLLNGKRVNIPSAMVKVGQEVSIKESSRDNVLVKDALAFARSMEIPAWVEVDSERMTGKLIRLPHVDEIGVPVREQLIVELYSK